MKLPFTTSSATSNAPSKESWHAPLNKVTPTSKILAAVVFISLPFLGFWLGLQFAASDQGAALITSLEL
jgi:hypothetical protein